MALVLIEIYIDHIADTEHIRITSTTFLSTFPAGSLDRLLSNLLLSSSAIHLAFLCSCVLLAGCYLFRLGGLKIVWLMFISEWIFQIVNAGNIYGYQGAIHQFLLLLVIIEIAQGRLQLLSGLATALIRLQLVTVYFMSGIAKILSPDWQSPDILQRIFLNSKYTPMFFDPLFAAEFFAPMLIVGAKAMLILFPAALINWRGRKFILAAGMLFHLVLALKMNLYAFGFFMVSLYLVLGNEAESSDQKSPLNPSI